MLWYPLFINKDARTNDIFLAQSLTGLELAMPPHHPLVAAKEQLADWPTRCLRGDDGNGRHISCRYLYVYK